MRLAFILILLFPVVGLAQSPQVKYQLEFGNVLSVYTDFKQIKPVLYNKSEKSIYLSSLFPRASTTLMRFNDEAQEWEDAYVSAGFCTNIVGTDEPIEVVAGGNSKIFFHWQFSVDDLKNPTIFKTSKLENRPLKGKYKLALQYAKEPFTLSNFAEVVILSIQSQEFLFEP